MGGSGNWDGSRTSYSLKETGLGSSRTLRTQFPSNIHTDIFLLTQHQTQSPTYVCGSQISTPAYAAFFCARNFAHLAFCAAAIFLRADADKMRLAGADPVFAPNVGCEFFHTDAHRAFCASAILRREAADMIRFVAVPGAAPVPFNDSIPEIIWFNFSNLDCVALRSLRSS